MSEHDQQVAVIDWAVLHEFKWPCLWHLYAIPNQGGNDLSSIIRGKKMAKEGLKKGVPDLCLPVARQGFHTLYIEMKEPGKYPSKEQKKRITGLKEEGHRVEVARSADEAINILVDYLTNKQSVSQKTKAGMGHQIT